MRLSRALQIVDRMKHILVISLLSSAIESSSSAASFDKEGPSQETLSGWTSRRYCPWALRLCQLEPVGRGDVHTPMTTDTGLAADFDGLKGVSVNVELVGELFLSVRFHRRLEDYTNFWNELPFSKGVGTPRSLCVYCRGSDR